ncbi:MAG TPA: hypothetical protein PKK18_02705 [Chitinophagales bacterium]|nr:hypothetical protein [Chitinophagales bacterium]HMW12267.1 hypothetical protein [Chitinophagales bacterium]HMX58944.1 hypothetical protein [Chitinophagales bacterium]HMY22676.1 hypothetical protein [Chitinophagales bacterium]HMZ32874.1 hypothetical protein [Chitinophagales bacterium]
MKFAGKLLFSICIFLSACKKNDTVIVQFHITQTKHTPNNRSYDLDLSKLKILFSNFTLIDVNGKSRVVKDIFLYGNGNNNFSFKMPKGNYTAFTFALGVDAATNNLMPASFPPSHPLSVENGLYWDMLKYRFIVAEGNIDDSALKNEIPDAPFSMHLGSDTLYTIINASAIPYDGTSVFINLNLDKLFVLDSDPFQITNFSNHSEASEIAKGIAIKDSFVDGITTSVVLPE